MTVPAIALGEIAEVRLGRQRSPKNHAGTQMRPYLRAANVGWDGLKLDDVKSMNFTDDEMTVYRLQPGDLLLSEASGSPNEVGKPALWTGEVEDCAFQNTLIRVRPHGADSLYLLHYLRHQATTGQFARGSRGVGIHHLGQAALAGWPVPLPPLDEQRRIAAILDQADALQVKRRQALSHLDDLAQSTFLDMFGDPLTNPAHWPRVPFGEIVPAIDGGQSPNCESRPAAADEWGILKLGAVTYGVFNEGQNKAFLGEASGMVKNEVRPGDLLFARKNTRELVGAAATVTKVRPKLLLPDLIFRLGVDADRVSTVYLQSLLMNARKRQQVRALSSGSAGSMPNISKARLRALPVETPPIDLQREFTRRVQAIEAVRHRQHEEAQCQAELRTSLQSRAFAGQL